jgi:hypothetical protein
MNSYDRSMLFMAGAALVMVVRGIVSRFEEWHRAAETERMNIRSAAGAEVIHLLKQIDYRTWAMEHSKFPPRFRLRANRRSPILPSRRGRFGN